MTTITIQGSSDDLIEISGAILEEFYLRDDDEGDLLAFSDGTVLLIKHTDSGVWRITLSAKGTGTLTVRQAPENDDDNYSDLAALEFDAGDVRPWVVQGVTMAVAR